MKWNSKKILLVIGVALAGGALFSFTKGDDRNFQIAKNLDVFNAVFKELDMFYVDTIDPEKVIKYGIDAMLVQTDPYTEYYPEDDNTLKDMTTGKFGGIGSVIRYYTPRKRVAIIEPTEGSPAAEIGLKAGDVIMEVNGKDMVQGSRTPNELSDYVKENLRGEPGTTCILKVDRPTSDSTYVPMEFKITRATIHTNPVPYYGMVKDNVGYIAISTFAIENCSKDIKKALIELKQQGAKSIVLDLRGNGGGLLGEAVNVVNFFVPKGKEIVVTKGKTKQAASTYKTMNEPIDLDIPLAVLVDGATASASEIVSGSLQDLDRAVVVGTRTYGKGLVQVLRELPYNSSMKVTTSKYYIPSGRCIQAIDYAKRNADGSVARTPDSLTNVFHTAAGREVRDGGGIRPDIEVKAEKFPNIMFYLLNDDMIFDYATQYCIKHPQIGEVKDFVITDADYAEFKQMLKKRKFTYDRQSEKSLKNLKEIAEFEGYMEGAKDEFAALEKKLTHNLDHELNRFSKEIKDAIAQEVVQRYYFQRGTVLQRLKDDPDLNKAIETLNNKVEYDKVLAVAK
ncbi:S41 family peptidase [Phocaeicola sp.]